MMKSAAATLVCTGVHIATDLQLVAKLRDGAIKPLLLLRGCDLAVYQLLAKH